MTKQQRYIVAEYHATPGTWAVVDTTTWKVLAPEYTTYNSAADQAAALNADDPDRAPQAKRLREAIERAVLQLERGADQNDHSVGWELMNAARAMWPQHRT